MNLRLSSLRRRIILPFAVLVVFVGVIGIAVVSGQVSSSINQTLDTSLVRSSLRTNDRLAAIENDRLQQLRASTDTVGVDAAVARGDAATAQRLLAPIVGNAQPEHLVLRVLTISGTPLLALRRVDGQVQSFVDYATYTEQAAVQQSLRGMSDALGDKYAFLAGGASPPMVYWVAPVRRETSGEPVGVILLGQPVSEIGASVAEPNSIYVMLYDLSGQPLSTSLPGVPSLMSSVVSQVSPTTTTRLSIDQSGHAYRQLVSTWAMRGTTVGYVGVAIPDDPGGSLTAIRLLLVALFGALALGTLLIGMALADRITRPIDQLVASMKVVSAGDYSRRVRVDSSDEIGYLDRTFNEMAAALQLHIRKREESYFRSLEALARAIDARDPYTFEHSARVAAISRELALELGLPGIEMDALRRGGLLHDVGKIGVPDQILGKTTPLTEEEWTAIRQHPVTGFDMLKDVPFLQPCLTSVRHHHERWDGEGYPDKLRGDQISPLARIVAVADTFDAMTSDRPYRKGFSFEFAAGTIVRQAGSQFDPAVVDAFKKRQNAIFTLLIEMGKKPTPHAADIRLEDAA